MLIKGRWAFVIVGGGEFCVECSSSQGSGRPPEAGEDQMPRGHEAGIWHQLKKTIGNRIGHSVASNQIDSLHPRGHSG